MRADHPLDRPVWNALTGAWAPLAQGGSAALRLDPDHGPFAATRDADPESLAALAMLIPPEGALAQIEAVARPVPAGVRVVQHVPLLQMSATAVAAPDLKGEAIPLGEADAEEMLALARLTEPGPFAPRTHRLGGFIGVRCEGRLAAMTGERMRFDGFTEVSAVCTHPDFRGRGYAAALTAMVTTNILARGETPFLHVFPHNAGAIAVYERLGFTVRREMTLTVLTRA